MTQQEIFEERIYVQYFISTIRPNSNIPRPIISDALNFVPVNCKDKATFLSKKPDGTYVEDTVNAAWWGWRASLKEQQCEKQSQL